MTPEEILAAITGAADVVNLGLQILNQLKADGSTQTTAEQTAAFQASQANAVSANANWLAALQAKGVTIPAAAQ